MPADDDMPDEVRMIVALAATWLYVQKHLRAGVEPPLKVMQDYADYTVEGLLGLMFTFGENHGVDGKAMQSEIAKALSGIARNDESLQ